MISRARACRATALGLLLVASLLSACSNCMMIDSCAARRVDSTRVQEPWPLPPGNGSGYNWTLFKHLAVQVPLAWSNTESVEERAGYRLTTLLLSPPGRTPQGLSVKFMPAFSRQFGTPPAEGAHALLRKQVTGLRPEDVLMQNTGSSTRLVIRYRETAAGQAATLNHRIFVVDAAHDALYIATFSWPESDWAEAGNRIGMPILDNLKLLP